MERTVGQYDIGLYTPDLKLYEYDANTLSLENLAGGTPKNLTLGTLIATTLKAPTGRGATYVIAASNSSATDKAQADAIDVTGTALKSLITTAESGVLANGGVLTICAGTYSAVCGIPMVNNLTITGTGTATLINVQNGNVSIYSLFTVPSTLSNIKITNMKIDLGGNTYAGGWRIGNSTGSTNVIISDITLVNGSSGSSYANGAIVNSTNVWLTNCVFDSLFNMGLSSNTNVHVLNNIYSNGGNGGFVLGSNAGLFVEGNYVSTSPYGIDVGASSSVIVTNNDVMGCTGAGGSIQAEPNGSTSLNISCNSVSVTVGGKLGIIVNNTGASSSLNINNNIIIFSGLGLRTGICVSGSGAWSYVNINNNTIIGAGYDNGSIYVHNANIVSINGNTTYSTDTSYPSIWIDSVTNSTITSNVLGASVSNGEIIRESGSTDYSVINDNRFTPSLACFVTKVGAHSSIVNNNGYIAKGEIRTISGTITGTAGDNGALMLSIDNPFGQAVRVTDVQVEITVQASAAATMDAGVGSSATADYTTMIAALPINPGTSYPYFYSAGKTAIYGQMLTVSGINWATGSGNRYLNFFNPSAFASGTVFRATYTITVMGN